MVTCQRGLAGSRSPQACWRAVSVSSASIGVTVADPGVRSGPLWRRRQPRGVHRTPLANPPPRPRALSLLGSSLLGSDGSGTPAHLADQFIVGKAVLHPPGRGLFDVNRIGQDPRRLLRQLRVPQALEQVNHVLPAVLIHDDRHLLFPSTTRAHWPREHLATGMFTRALRTKSPFLWNERVFPLAAPGCARPRPETASGVNPTANWGSCRMA